MTGIHHPPKATPAQTAPAVDGLTSDTAASPSLAATSVAAPARGAIRHALCEIASGAAHFAQRLSPAQLVAMIAGARRTSDKPAGDRPAAIAGSETTLNDGDIQATSNRQFNSAIDRLLDLALAPIELTRQTIERVSSWLAPTTSEIVFTRRRLLPAQFDVPETQLAPNLKPSSSPHAVIVQSDELRPPSDKKKEAFVNALEQAAVEARYARKEAKEHAETRAEDEHRRKVSASRDRVLARDMQNGISNPRAAELANQLDGPFAASENMVLAQIDDLNRAEQKERS